jgi:hypothetical protein
MNFPSSKYTTPKLIIILISNLHLPSQPPTPQIHSHASHPPPHSPRLARHRRVKSHEDAHSIGRQPQPTLPLIHGHTLHNQSPLCPSQYRLYEW